MRPSHELMQAAIPTRHDKKRVARALNLSESQIYKWCEDPDGSGKANPLDRLEVIIDHALVHHSDAAQGIIQHLDHRYLLKARARTESLSFSDLVVLLQPQSEQEATEAISAFSHALRQLVLGDECDLTALLKEVNEAERAMRNAGVMIKAAIEAERSSSTP